MAGVTAVVAVVARAAIALTSAVRQPATTVQLTAWTGHQTRRRQHLRQCPPAASHGAAKHAARRTACEPAQQLNPACQPYPGGTTGLPSQFPPLLKAVFPRPYQAFPLPPPRPSMSPASGVPAPAFTTPNNIVIVIDLALPSDGGVQLDTTSSGTAFSLCRRWYSQLAVQR